MRLALREVALAFRRAPVLALLSVVTIGFSLVAVGLFGLVALNIRQALQSVEARVEVRAFLVDAAPAAQVDALVRALRASAEVAAVGVVTSDSALVRARAELEEFRDVLEDARLPASIELRLRDGHRDPASVQAIARRLERSPLVEDVRYGREWVEKLHRLRTIAGLAAAVLGGVFALVAVIITGSTIRLSILARAREIEIMRLVGATNAFVRLPYLIDGLVKGLAGGVLAVGLTSLAHQLVTRLVMQTAYFTWPQALLGVLAGGVVGCAGSWVSVGRHLRRIWRDG